MKTTGPCLIAAAALLVVLTAPATHHVVAAQGGSLPPSVGAALAAYAALTSYADTGTIRQEVPGIVDESRFTTKFRRATGDLYFEYQGLTSTTTATRYTIDMRGHRLVLWMADSQMQKYDYASRTHELVPPGNGQVRALQALVHPTHGTSILVPSLLYPKAQLASAILQLETAQETGFDMVGGRKCHKIAGVAAARYPSGQRAGARQVTIWIDTETHLVRQVFEDTPEEYAPGAYQKTTITIDPRANVPIADDAFKFTPPQ